MLGVRIADFDMARPDWLVLDALAVLLGRFVGYIVVKSTAPLTLCIHNNRGPIGPCRRSIRSINLNIDWSRDRQQLHTRVYYVASSILIE